MRGKTTPIFFSVLLLLSVTAVLSFIRSAHASPKSLYLVADHHTRQFDAWEIKPDGTTDYQATYRLSYATDPAGIAIDETSNTLFITSEFSGGVEMVDATTMTSVGVSAGPSNLAGIAVDDANDIVYAVRRWSDDLYVYDWNPSTNTLTVRAGYNPLNLPGCSGAFGLGLDEIRGILWVADSAAGIVRAYDTDTWTEDTSQSFTPSHKAVDVAIDRMRRLVYTVSMSLGASVPGGCGSNLLSKYDLTARTETTVNLGHQGVGVAVDELTGYVYVTGDYYARRLEVWDVSPTPWIQVQQVSVSGRPAGICIPQEEVAFNPFNLSKDDGLAEGECISPGEDITYEICYDNTENSYDAHKVKIVDELPTEVSFLSATGGGSYDSNTYSVIWDIGTLSAGAAQHCVELTVHVFSTVAPGSTIVNYATIDSDETPATPISESTDVCPLPDEVGLEVVVTPKRLADGDYYEIGETIEFEVTVHNPTDVDAYQVKLTAVEPPEIEIEEGWFAAPWPGKPDEDIPAGDTKNTTFEADTIQNGENVGVIVNAWGYTDIYEAGKIRGTGNCFINIHPEEEPDWSFAVIADPHIGYRIPDYDGEGWEDSEPLPQECNYEATDWLDNVVKTIVMERDYYNIEFVVVLGDFADTAEKSEFFKAREILNKLNDAGIPYIPVIGDHDQWPYIQDEKAATWPDVRGSDYRKETFKEKATYAYGDEWFNEIFWGDENDGNLNLIRAVFNLEERPGKVDRDVWSYLWWRDVPVYLQNRVFSYKGINFICLDFNPRKMEPGAVLGAFATDYELTKTFLENHLETGKTTIILSHHPFSLWGGFRSFFPFSPLLPERIAEIVCQHGCGGKTYNFGGHVHYSLNQSAYYLTDKAYEIVSTEAVNKRVPSLCDEYPSIAEAIGAKREGKPIRIVQVKSGNINYSTLLKPVREVPIKWPRPIFDYMFGGHSYPEPNEEITFTAHFTTYYGFKTSFDWGFGDGSYGSGLSVTHGYSQDGEYNVILTATTKNLVTEEEKTYTVTGLVYVHSKHVISSLPSDLNATSLLTEEDLTQVPKNTYQHALITKIASEETAIAELGVHFEEAIEDIDFSTLIADVDLGEGKSVIYMPTWPEEIDDYKTLFIPSTGAGTVYICLDATSLDEVSLENAGLIINVGETKDNVAVATTFYNGREYYLVSGVTGTGGGELKDTIPPTTVPTIGEPKYVDLMDNIYVSSATLFTLTAEDNPSGTGVASTAYSVCNATHNSGWIDYSAPFRLPVWLENGVYTIAYNSTDNMGNMEEANIMTIVLSNPLVDTWVTDSNFNEIESFRAVFTPHGNTELHKLTATNPGQFYFNILVNNTWPEPLNMTIDYSIDANFTLKGARPIHVYADLNRSIDITAHCTFTDNTITVYNVTPNATAYVTIHLDYALKGTTWTAEEVEVWYSEHGFNATVGSVTSTVVITDPNLQTALMPARLILFISILPILMLGLGAFAALLKQEMLGAERRK